MRYLWVLPLLLLFGCGAQTTGKDLTIRNTFEFGDVYAPVTISPNLSTESGDNTMDVEAPTEIDANGELILSPAQVLDNAVQAVADKAILDQATEMTKDISDETTPAVSTQAAGSDEALAYQTRFHHTMWDPDKKADGGKSLVLCPGQEAFEKCTANIVEIPLRDGLDDGRISYWLQDKAPVGDIVCKDSSGKEYRFKSDELQVNGQCD